MKSCCFSEPKFDLTLYQLWNYLHRIDNVDYSIDQIERVQLNNWQIFFLFDSFYNPSLQCNPLWNVKASFTENFCYKHWSASRKCWSSACMSTQALWAHSSSNADLKVYLVKMSAVKWILVFFCVLFWPACVLHFTSSIRMSCV